MRVPKYSDAAGLLDGSLVLKREEWYPLQKLRQMARGQTKPFRAHNSAVECHLHTVEVVGSNPAVPTIKSTTYEDSASRFGAIWCQSFNNWHQLCRFFPPQTYMIRCGVFVAVSIAYTVPTICCTLSGSSCMYSFAVV